VGKFFIAVIAIFLSFGSVQAEELDYFKIDGIQYDPAVVEPAAVLGHQIADQPARHDLMVDYLRRVAEKSPRMKVETIGYSHERRPILFITVTSAENHARLDAIREAHITRSDPTSPMPSGDLPVVTWLNYGVHGAEASGMEAAMPTIYHLAAAQGTEIEDQLANSVILITAVFNPDGHSRRANYVTSFGTKVVNTNPDHQIHNGSWGGFRTNHYWFDLNRQWLLQTQPESQAWLSQWHKWKPQVTGDFHEMGANSTYYFHPGTPNRKNPLIPAQGRELLQEIANYHRAYMDGEAKLYFAEEGFDNFYIGKGSTYPQVNGSVGILYEAGATAGGVIETQHGIKRYANSIRNHFRTGITTIQGAVAMRQKLHAYQREFFEQAVQDASKSRVKGWVFQAPEDPARMYHFLDLLERHKIEARPLTSALNAGGKSWKPGEAWVVVAEQAQYQMARGIFERPTKFQENVYYDVSGWTLPLAYGLDFADVTSSIRESSLGDAAKASFPVGSNPGMTDYAWAFSWSDYYAPRAMSRLMQKGVIVRQSMKPFQIMTSEGLVAFGRGDVIVPLERQPIPAEEIADIIADIAAKDGLHVYNVTTGDSAGAGSDLGGRDSFFNPKPVKPLLLIGDNVTSYDAGEVWHQLDYRMEMPVTLVDTDRFKNIALHDYSHIIVVNGRWEFNSEMTKAIKAWVKEGGTIVAMRNAAKWAETLMNDGAVDAKDSDDKKSKDRGRLNYADKYINDAEHVIGGAIFAGDVDISHPIGFGYVRRSVALHRNTVMQLKPSTDPYATVVAYSDDPLLTGYASKRRIDELKGKPAVIAERVGRGAIIRFADNPNFRGTFLGNSKMFMNSLFLSTAFQKARDVSDAAVEHQH